MNAILFLMLLAQPEWRSIPGSTMDSVYIESIDDQWQLRLGKWPNAWRNIQTAWSGGVCSRDRLYIFGGGHNDSPHNGVLSVDPVSGEWRRESEPSGLIWNKDIPCPGGVCAAPHGDCFVVNGSPQCGEMFDGKPMSAHSYYLLATDGDNIYIIGGGRFPGGNAGAEPVAWRFNLDAREWTPMASPSLNVVKGHGHLQYVDGKLYYNTAGGWRIHDLSTGTWSGPSGGAAGIGGQTSHVYVPTTDQFIYVGNNVARRWSRSTWGTKAGLVPLTGAPAAILEGDYVGVTYYPPTDRVYYWDGGPTIHVLNPHTYAWSTLTPSGNPGAAIGQGTFGRFSYCGGRLILVNGVTQPLFYLEE